MKVNEIRNNHLLNLVTELFKGNDEDEVTDECLEEIIKELMLARFIAPYCDSGILRMGSKKSNGLFIPIFTSMNEYDSDIQEKTRPISWKIEDYFDLIGDLHLGGIVINPKINDFFLPLFLIVEIIEYVPIFTDYNKLKSKFTNNELTEIFNEDTSGIDSYLDNYAGNDIIDLLTELSKSNLYTYIASKDDLSDYIDGNIIETHDVNNQGILTPVDENNQEINYIFTSPKYFQPTQSDYEKQGWNLFALPTTLELMARYLIERDCDALVVNPSNHDIVIDRQDLLDNLHMIVDKTGENIERYLGKYSFSLTTTTPPKTAKKDKNTEGYKVKVILDDLTPTTWRDVIIPSDITFDELDSILKTLWGFTAKHPSVFQSEDDTCIMDKDFDEIVDAEYDSRTTKIGDFFDNNDKISYKYDFGDEWIFTLEIKNKIDYDKEYTTIERVEGEYNPIEDCGGVFSLSQTIYYSRNPDEKDDSKYKRNVKHLKKFDFEYTQNRLKNRDYVVNPFL